MRRLITLLSLSIFLAYGSATAQGRLSGTVVNASDKTPIEYATVSLIASAGGKTVNGGITDKKGAFSFKNIPAGTYQLKIESIGFTTMTRSYTMSGADIGAGSIALTQGSASLGAVTVTGRRPLVETRIDRMIYNAANDLTAQSGAALDVLKKVPSVAVDIDGNVELEGNPNIRFLINGKPSTMFGASLPDVLQSIPASQIKSIEVITSPGAKYDAAGTGGIINIILKDSKLQGINGTVNVSAGTRLENGSFNLNARKNNIGINAFFSGNAQRNTPTLIHTSRTSYNTTRDTLTLLDQNGTSKVRRSGYQGGASLQWDITPRDKLSATFNFDHFGFTSEAVTAQLQQTTDAADKPLAQQNSTRSSGSHFSENSSDFGLDYKKEFKRKGQELDILLTTSIGKNQSNYYQQQAYQDGSSTTGSRGNNPGTARETDMSIDYSMPLGKEMTLETGAKAIFEHLDNTVFTDTLLPDLGYHANANQTYGFTYRRHIIAGYVSTSFGLFHSFIKGQAGLRYEYTGTTADFPGTHIPGYSIWAPSLVFTHSFDETQSIKASYTWRIERPDYEELNPFYNISDPHNISTGNPNLRPEKGRRYELGYNRSFSNDANIYIGALYRYNSDDLQALAAYYPSLTINGTTYTDLSLTQRYNIGWQNSIGANIFGSLSPTKALSLRTNIQLGNRTNNSPGLATVSGFAMRANLNISYKFKNDLQAEIFGNYNSSQKNIQGTRPAFGFYTLAMRKDVFHKKASLGITATNPFNKYIDQKATLFGTSFYQQTLRKVPYQSFGITLSYKFGKLEFKGKEHKNDNEPAPIE